MSETALSSATKPYGGLMLPSRNAVLPWVRRYIEDERHSGGIQIAHEYSWDFRVLGGLLERVRRAAEAYLLLERDGFAAEGRPLVRSALEHAVIAQWAFLTPSGVDRLEVGILRSRIDYAKRTRDDDDPEWDDMITRMQQRIPLGADGRIRRGMPKFSGRDSILSTVDHTRYLRRAYAVLSRAGHVTDQAVTDYFVSDGDTTAVAATPADTYDLDVFHTLATCCCLAGWLQARLEGDVHEQNLATRQRLLWRLDTHLAREQRRFPDETDD